MRSVSTRYANESDFLSGKGAAKYGGRWNKPGIVAIYGSTDVLTATLEAYQQFVAFGFSLSAIKPRVMAGIHVHVQFVLDLSKATNRRKIGFNRNELLTEDWQAIQSTGVESWTQAIGRGAMQAGFEGLLVPSAQNRNGTNLVVFPGKLRETSSLKVLAKSELPPHPRSWPEK
ncbi:MAG: RES family NAD+ phosphorylase [Pirellulaceae bacterium]